LGRAIIWTATTIAKILHDALDADAKGRRRDRAGDWKKPPADEASNPKPPPVGE